MIGLTESLALWYFTRSSGALSLILLTIAFALGTPTLLSWGNERVPRLVLQLLHRNISLLVVVFVFLHVASTVVDGYAPIGWLDAIIPFRSGYRPIWVGFGTTAVLLLLAIIITSLLRVRIGYARWRWVHMLSYALWPIALVHGLGTGSDTRSAWMMWIVGVCTAVVLACVVIRVHGRAPRNARSRNWVIAALVLVPVLIAAWTVLGPMKPDWGKKRPSQGQVSETVVVGEIGR